MPYDIDKAIQELEKGLGDSRLSTMYGLFAVALAIDNLAKASEIKAVDKIG